MPSVVTGGEIMLRLKSPGHERVFPTSALEGTAGGGEASVAVSLASFGLPGRARADARFRRHVAVGIANEEDFQ